MASKEKGKLGLTTDSKVNFNTPLKINKWSTSALKNALDDTVKKIAKEEYNFVENYNLMDQRLAICTIACSFSGFAMLYDYLYPFPASRLVLASCAICYFLMIGVLTLFTMYKEKNIFMVALEKDKAGVGPDNIWTFQSSLPRFTDLYSVMIICRNGQTKKTSSAKIEKSVSNWFNGDGELVTAKFLEEIKNMHSDISKSKKDD